MVDPIYDEIKGHVDRIRLVDTHEHLISESERLKSEVDVLATFFPHYASSDLRSAGMTEGELLKIRDPSIPLDDRWAVFEPFWEMIRNTGYARAIEIAARDLYGVDGISSRARAKRCVVLGSNETFCSSALSIFNVSCRLSLLSGSYSGIIETWCFFIP